MRNLISRYSISLWKKTWKKTLRSNHRLRRLCCLCFVCRNFFQQSWLEMENFQEKSRKQRPRAFYHAKSICNKVARNWTTIASNHKYKQLSFAANKSDFFRDFWWNCSQARGWSLTLVSFQSFPVLFTGFAVRHRRWSILKCSTSDSIQPLSHRRSRKRRIGGKQEAAMK